MRRIVSLVAAAMLGVFAGCIDTRFLEGVHCSHDDDCGRSLKCEAGICGGCPEGGLGKDGRCDCPGDRVLECAVLPGDDPCVAVCASEVDLCAVAVRLPDGDHEVRPACTGPDDPGPCFRMALDAPGCAGEAAVSLQPAPPEPPELLVNCPPPASEDGRFDCE